MRKLKMEPELHIAIYFEKFKKMYFKFQKIVKKSLYIAIDMYYKRVKYHPKYFVFQAT